MSWAIRESSRVTVPWREEKMFRGGKITDIKGALKCHRAAAKILQNHICTRNCQATVQGAVTLCVRKSSEHTNSE